MSNEDYYYAADSLSSIHCIPEERDNSEQVRTIVLAKWTTIG